MSRGPEYEEVLDDLLANGLIYHWWIEEGRWYTFVHYRGESFRGSLMVNIDWILSASNVKLEDIPLKLATGNPRDLVKLILEKRLEGLEL